jgi:Family of unknown function (DUF6389)
MKPQTTEGAYSDIVTAILNAQSQNVSAVIKRLLAPIAGMAAELSIVVFVDHEGEGRLGIYLYSRSKNEDRWRHLGAAFDSEQSLPLMERDAYSFDVCDTLTNLGFDWIVGILIELSDSGDLNGRGFFVEGQPSFGSRPRYIHGDML